MLFAVLLFVVLLLWQEDKEMRVLLLSLWICVESPTCTVTNSL
jgi:hypothetical protein